MLRQRLLFYEHVFIKVVANEAGHEMWVWLDSGVGDSWLDIKLQKNCNSIPYSDRK